MIITITSNSSGLTKDFMRHLRGIVSEDLFATVKYYVEHQTNVRIQIVVWGNASDHVQKKPKWSSWYQSNGKKPSEEKPRTEKPEEKKPREEKPQSEKPESPKPTEEPEEESPEEPEEPQVETEKVEGSWEAEELLAKIQDPIIKSNAKETLTGLKITCYLVLRITIPLWLKLESCWGFIKGEQVKGSSIFLDPKNRIGELEKLKSKMRTECKF